MPDRPLLSATLIAKDEKHNIKRCFDSLWPHVDEIVLVDTGSTDGTVAEAKRYASAHAKAGSRKQQKLKVARFAWADDFAAARQAADDLATGEWFVWADMDDEIVGLAQLRDMVANAPDDVRAFFARYRYAADPSGNAISELWRERIVRNDGTKWTGRLHEHKLFEGGGQIVKVDPQIAEWVHHRDHEQRTADRNLRILEAWLADEPDSPRVISSLALEYMGCERFQEAADMFARYLAIPGEPADRRCQASRHLSVMLTMLNRPHDARNVALQSLAEEWSWADTHLTMAETAQTLGRPDLGIQHAQQALALGKPDTLLIVNPLQYTAQPHAIMAVCHAMMGRYDDAVREAEETLAIAPTYALAAEHLPRFRAGLRRQQATAAFLSCAEVLIEAGELVKAWDLLGNAPWYVIDEPQIVKRRGEIGALIDERVAAPKVAMEDEAADLFVARHQEIAA